MSRFFNNTVFALLFLVLALFGAAQADSVQRLNLPCNDVVYSPITRSLYIAVRPEAARGRANSLTPVNPINLNVGVSFPFAAQPYRLAISDDGKFVYTAVNNATVSRFDVAKRTAAPSFSTGYGVQDMKVQPGNSDVIAVSRPTDEPGIYNNGVPLTFTANRTYRHNVLEWGRQTLYIRWITHQAAMVLASSTCQLPSIP